MLGGSGGILAIEHRRLSRWVCGSFHVRYHTGRDKWVWCTDTLSEEHGTWCTACRPHHRNLGVSHPRARSSCWHGKSRKASFQRVGFPASLCSSNVRMSSRVSSLRNTHPTVSITTSLETVESKANVEQLWSSPTTKSISQSEEI